MGELLAEMIRIKRHTRTFNVKASARKKIGDNIKRLLKEKHMSQAELGRRMGVTRSAAYYWANGKCNILNANLPSIAMCLGVNVKELLDGIEMEDLLS